VEVTRTSRGFYGLGSDGAQATYTKTATTKIGVGAVKITHTYYIMVRFKSAYAVLLVYINLLLGTSLKLL